MLGWKSGCMDFSRFCGQNNFLNILPHRYLPLQSTLFTMSFLKQLYLYTCTSVWVYRFHEWMQNSAVPHTHPSVPQDSFFWHLITAFVMDCTLCTLTFSIHFAMFFIFRDSLMKEGCIRKKRLYLQHLTNFFFFFSNSVDISVAPAIGLCKEQCLFGCSEGVSMTEWSKIRCALCLKFNDRKKRND